MALGAAGEDMAAAWYQRHGYELISRNWRCREGEIDIVARRGDVLVFCEVKTRSSTRFGTPAEAVTHTKRQRLRRLALQFLTTEPVRASQLRFDVAGILDGRLEVVQNAF